MKAILEAGVDPNQNCAIIVGAFVIVQNSVSQDLYRVSAVYDDNTCDLTQLVDNSKSKKKHANIETSPVTLLSCAVLTKYSKSGDPTQASCHITPLFWLL